MRHFSVKNFDRFQHYKDRSPPWIKLYNELLDDYAFGQLSDQTKFHLVAIWLLASRTENKIPHDPQWIAARINAKNRVDLDALEKAGFIVVSQDAPEGVDGVGQNASKALDQRREEERQRREEQKAIEAEFEGFWAVYPRRVGKGDARRAFMKAREKADLATLVAGVKRMPPASDPKFIPHASTWLNGERWLDGMATAKPIDALPPPKSDREVWADLLARYKPGGFWPPNKGARPETGYCDAPADLLTDWQHRTGANAA
jgi:hypothetical protein